MNSLLFAKCITGLTALKKSREIRQTTQRSGFCLEPVIQGLLSVVLHPLTQPNAVHLWTDGGEGPPWVSQSLPQMLQSLLKAINSENVNDANEIALLRPINGVERIL